MNTQTVTLDVTKRRQVMPEIRIGQGDENGTTLVANIYDNGEPFTLTNYTVRFAMRLPFDMAYYSVVGTVSGNTATFQIDESYAASVAGVTEVAYVEVLSGTTVICSTNRIRVVCLESAYENVDPAHLWDNGVEQFLEDAQDTLDAAVAQAQIDVSDAVDDAEAATTRATQAAEAAEGVVLDALPTMTANLKGGAKLGSGLEVVSDTLSIDLTDNATGESVTADDASYLASLTVDGKAVQDGTPTPDNPVDVQVVALNWNQQIKLMTSTTLAQDVNFINNGDGSFSLSGSPSTDFWPTRFNSSDTVDFINGHKYAFLCKSNNPQITPYFNSSAFGSYFAANNIKTCTNSSSDAACQAKITGGVTYSETNKYILQVFDLTQIFGAGNEPSTIAEFEAMYPEAYYQYDAGSTQILLKTGTSYTPIDLQGNVLASLPDGTKDVLTVDSVGHVVLEKRVGVVDLGSKSWSNASTKTSGERRYYTAINDIKAASSSSETANVYCSNYTAGSNDSTYNQVNGVGIQTAGTVVIFDESYKTSDSTVFKTAVSGVLLYYQLATPQTIDLGYIDMPAIPDGSTISITAQVTPTIAASWWARGAAAIAEALQAVRARIDAIEAAIAELATS